MLNGFYHKSDKVLNGVKSRKKAVEIVNS